MRSQFFIQDRKEILETDTKFCILVLVTGNREIFQSADLRFTEKNLLNANGAVKTEAC